MSSLQKQSTKERSSKEKQLLFNDTLMKYGPPEDAIEPDEKWICTIFKDTAMLEMIKLTTDHYLFGKDENIVDIVTAHESCSKQHVVIQFRRIPTKSSRGHEMTTIRPYIIDLNSANGTKLNGKFLEPERFYELKDKDVVNLGASTRDYVFLVDDGKAYI